MGYPKQSTYFAKIAMRGLGQGFTARHNLGYFASYSDAITVGGHLVKAWRMILAANIEIGRAAIYRYDQTRKRWRIITSPVVGFTLDTEAGTPPASPALTPCNNIETCIDIEFSTTSGTGLTRQIRGIRDNWITNGALGFTPTVPATVDPLTDFVAGSTKEVALGVFMGSILMWDKQVTNDEAVLGTLLADSYSTSAVVGIATRDTGLYPFHRRGRKSA